MGRSGKPLRYSALVAAVVAVLACVGAASAGAAPTLWTANAGGKSVSTIDTGTNLEVGAPIEVGAGPGSIAITPNGKRAVVASEAGESVTVLEAATRTPVGTVALGSRGKQVAIAPNGKLAYVTDAGDDQVHVISTETASELGSFVVGPNALSLAFAPGGTRAYVGTEKGVAVVETASQSVVGAPIGVGGSASSLAFAPDGKTAYATSTGVSGIAVIDTALGQTIRNILLPAVPTALAVSPNGKRLYATSSAAGTVTVIETASDEVVGTPLEVGKEPHEIALTPNGGTAYVAVTGDGIVQPIATATNTLLAPIDLEGKGVEALVVAPDQSPTASFVAPAALATFSSFFDGSASTDPDGLVSEYAWSFGDGTTGSGPGVNHAYRAPGSYGAELSVVDNEGCGAEQVFTGRTAYCSGNPLAKATHPVEVKAPAAVCSSRFSFGRMIHNRKNGTVRLQVKLRSTGAILLFGKKVHAVTRKVKKKGSLFLTIHARVELNKRLKKIHRTNVRVRVTFTPSAGCGFKTVHRSVALLRAKKKRHHH
jgi:YVTN family beta-propeller protein